MSEGMTREEAFKRIEAKVGAARFSLDWEEVASLLMGAHKPLPDPDEEWREALGANYNGMGWAVRDHRSFDGCYATFLRGLKSAIDKAPLDYLKQKVAEREAGQ